MYSYFLYILYSVLYQQYSEFNYNKINVYSNYHTIYFKAVGVILLTKQPPVYY